ncbi:hypothetical protein [Chitinophaga sp. 212800010-3]|uniref:hypothetical protein n=1 Tax=unclassified Chitinophaga TaxID=2619133 RepID=UPI002E132CFE
MFARRFLFYTALVALIIFGIAAYNCQGYYHPDEHYQIIEFAGLKTGTNSGLQLPWEYAAQVRPSLQPYLCLFVFRSLALVNVADPYQCAFALRMLTAIVAVLIVSFFVHTYMPAQHRNKQVVFILLSFFLWYMPYLSTRFSSEIWAGLSFLLAVALVKRNNHANRNYIIAGFCMGLAFLFRYQMAFMIGGLILWLLIVRRISLSLFLFLSLGNIIALLLGGISDYFFYGNIVFPYVNYFEVNILHDVASKFGVSPWYYYLQYIYYSMYPLCGTLVLACLLLVIIRRPKSIFTWMLLPFLLVHFIVPHKEGRFLFPLIYFVPSVLMLSYDILQGGIQKLPRFLRIGLAMPFLFVNALAMGATTMKAAGNGRKNICQYIHQRYGSQCVLIRYTYRSNPYNTWFGLEENFYREKCLRSREIVFFGQLNRYPGSNDDCIQLVTMSRRDAQERMMSGALIKGGWELEKSGIPQWIQYLQQYYQGYDLEEPLQLYKRIAGNGK